MIHGPRYEPDFGQRYEQDFGQRYYEQDFGPRYEPDLGLSYEPDYSPRYASGRLTTPPGHATRQAVGLRYALGR